MAKKGGKRGSSSARSAAAKKGWETRRQGGAGSKTQPSKPKAPAKPKAPPKTTTARGRARTAETRARAAVKAGGGSRAARSLATAQRARAFYAATGTGTKRSKMRSYGPANGIRRTGGLPRQPAASGIRPTTRAGRQPLALRSSNIRPYKPATDTGKRQKAERSLSKAVDNIRTGLDAFKQGKARRQELLGAAAKLQLRSSRMTARDIATSMQDNFRGRLSRTVLSTASGSMLSDGRDVIRRRAARASAAAARGSKPAARAREIYGQQLAATGPGKPAKAKSGIRPGPRNTKGTPPKRRRRRR